MKRTHTSSPNTVSKGMTLIEIVLVIGLLALLLSLAMPSYQAYLERGRRVDAVRLLLSAAACQERQRAGKGSFDTTQCSGNSSNEFYQLTIEPAGQSSSRVFLLTAEPVNQQQRDMCGSFSLDQSGTQGISGPQEKLRKCWAGH